MDPAVVTIRRWALFFAIIFVFLLFLVEGEVRASAKGWLAFGDLRGSLEPCGCDPKTDLGGIKRIITAVGRERLLMPNVGVFCLGNTQDPVDGNQIKNDFLLRGLALVRPNATLFNHLEWRSISWFERLYSSANNLLMSQKFVLSNLRKKTYRSWIQDVVRTDDFVIFGYVFGPEITGKVEPFSDSLVSRWRRLLGSEDAKRQKILLFSGSLSDLEKIRRVQFFDSIISSHASDFGEIPSTKDKDNELRLVRQQGTNLSRGTVWMVPLAGQGYLRGGDLLNRQGASLGQLFSVGERERDTRREGGISDLNKALNRPQNFSWLLPDIGENKPSQELYEEYMQETKRVFGIEAEKRIKDLQSSPYAGVEACISCHPSEVEVWKKSKHAHAMDTLARKGKDQDPECVVCHAVGAKEKGGFISLKHSPALAGVQCENCHGPRRSHTQNPLNSPKAKEESFKVCIGCHNSQHSPGFSQKEYWLRIEHGSKSAFKSQGEFDR